MAQYLASGDWKVTEGREHEFVARWKEWIEASVGGVPGFRSARLARGTEDARHFVSFSEWDDEESRRAWKESTDFAEGLARVRELCDEFHGGDYTEVAAL